LARYGYKKMTMDDLASEAGIGKGSIYLHFKSKEEVALSHLDRIVERLSARLRSIADSDAPPTLKIEQMLRERVLFRFDSVQHYSQSLDDLLAAIRGQLLARRQSYFEAEARIFADVLRDGEEQGIFQAVDKLAVAETLLIATNSLLPYSLSTRELGAREDVEEKITRLAALLLEGLLSRVPVNA
jgi:AcrR family transcriptional regulator